MQAAAQTPVDTVEMTSVHIERENSPKLVNWAVFEAGREVVCLPPGWNGHLENDGNELVLLPPDNPDSTERVTLTRVAKGNPTMDYLALARRQATSAFTRFGAVEADTLRHLVFPQAFAVERNVGFRAQGRAFRGYCLVYVDDKNLYQFRIILAKDRLQAYSGSLFRDIIGNLQIDHQYFVEHLNQLKQIIYLR